MPFNILAIRTADDTDGSVWPVPARQPGGQLTEAEHHDGPSVVTLPVAAVFVGEVTGGGIRDVLRLSDITAWVTITDSRVIFAASKWDKGSSYIGFGGLGVAVALASTGVSKARAAARSRGKILAGQVRYPTLSFAGARQRDGRRGSDQIRLGFSRKLQGAPPAESYVLDLSLYYGSVNPMQAAEDIIRRCAAYRLAHYPGDDQANKARLNGLLTAQIRAQPGKFGIVQMPVYYYVGSRAAIPPGLDASSSSRTPGRAEGLSR